MDIELKNVGDEKKVNATFLIKLGGNLLATIFLDNPNVFTKEEYTDFVNHVRDGVRVLRIKWSCVFILATR